MRRFLVVVLFLLTQAAFALESVPMAEYHGRRVKLGAKLHGGAALVNYGRGMSLHWSIRIIDRMRTTTI